MASLARDLRKELERSVKQARSVAEAGALKVLEQLGVHHHEPYGPMTPEQRALRNRLRAHGRQLGDRRDSQKGTQTIGRLVQECAYEHWHRMLFARFLAESDLLIEPQSGVAITLEECRELAHDEGADWLALASDYAERMLPQIFRKDDPVLAVTLPPETWSELEDLLKALPREVFTADDSLGWVYQFWQADAKEAVNKSEKKIGADELPAVTQLFTEDYMVLFLLHNTLGAWWAGKVLAERPELATTAKSEDELRDACKVGDVEWSYLRFVRNEGKDGSEGPWRPAAGTFDDWPKAVKDITMLDPCMGSGHFLVFVLPILLALRTAEEGLTLGAAVEAVLRDNMFGLEIDQRCTQIAAFNLAFATWRMVGYRPMPRLNLACSGLAIAVSKAEWLRLAEKAVAAADPDAKRDLLGVEENLLTVGIEARVKNGLEGLYDLFTKAPWLGSLIDPLRTEGDFFTADFAELEPLLGSILLAAESDEMAEMAVAAQGMAKAAEILGQKFTLVATNVPYLGIRKQSAELRDYLEKNHKDARHDLATSFVDRVMKLCAESGTVSVVIPQTFMLMQSYRAFRERLLGFQHWLATAILGPGAFGTISGEVVKPSLFIFCNSKRPSSTSSFFGLDVSDLPDAKTKARSLRTRAGKILIQDNQFSNPDSRVIIDDPNKHPILTDIASSLAGIQNGDSPKYLRYFWELADFNTRWSFLQSAVIETSEFGGLDTVIDYDFENGHLRADANWRRSALHDSDQRGKPFWGKRGVLVSRMAQIPCTLYLGNLYDQASAAIVASHERHLPAIWAYCSSNDYQVEVRKIDSKLGVTSATLVKVPIDLEYWSNVAREKYPSGLPSPYSDLPTQWIFDGHPRGSSFPLHVASARLLGYHWPRQAGASFLDCPDLGPDDLEMYDDDDGIVCLSATKGEAPAHERLIALLADAFGAEWSAAKLAKLLDEVGYARKTLDDWLRDGFFEQHCALFKNRPFIWHIWDGRRDGFHALINYHRLAAPGGEGRRTIEKLIYSYLGDWIDRQRSNQKAGIEGADGRLAAAEHLRSELTKILEGEPPYDIFVRWKPLHQQPIGWEPDINDGVRMNIRPFMTARPLGARAKTACILRTTPKSLKWDKDRGKEPTREKEDYPWFWGWDAEDAACAIDFAGGPKFDGNRWNEPHYTRAFKEAARARQAAKLGSKK